MSPNGRRAWRVAAKKLRRKIGRRVRDLDHRSTPISGAWFRRHGFTMDDPRYQIRQYIGTWGTVDGDGVEFAIKPASFTPRSLVGMTQGARKRAIRRVLRSEMPSCYRIPGAFYRIGQKLRPCPGCVQCFVCVCCENDTCACSSHSASICDGSGVLPARRA
mgnify:CR=1 FL=1